MRERAEFIPARRSASQQQQQQQEQEQEQQQRQQQRQADNECLRQVAAQAVVSSS